VVFTFALLGLWILKLYTTARAVLWLRRHGAEYRVKIEKTTKSQSLAGRDVSDEDLCQILDSIQGARRQRASRKIPHETPNDLHDPRKVGFSRTQKYRTSTTRGLKEGWSPLVHNDAVVGAGH